MNQSSGNQSKNVLFITTSNLTTNPRLLKEASVAAANGYSVTILCFQYMGWSEMLDIQWMAANKQIYVRKISALAVKNGAWLFSGFIEKLFQLLYPLYKKTISLNAYASSKRSFLLNNAIFNFSKQNSNTRFQLIVAHNMGSLYPAWLYHRKTNIPFIFDVEDYHPGEQINIDATNEKHRREFLLHKLLPDAACITVASPLIGERIKTLVGEGAIKNMVVINNCFPADEFEFINSRTKGQNLNRNDNELGTNTFKFSHFQIDKIHFVWFSQNIAANRGLELIIPELSNAKDDVHLHLIGNLYDDFNREWIVPNHDFITTYPPMPQRELNRFICQFDVGLALELAAADENRQICLTNKIWAYLQAGLYILATNTTAQIGFMKEHEGNGSVFEVITTPVHEGTNAGNSLFTALKYIIANIEEIRKAKRVRFTEAKKFAWEEEQGKLLQVWDKICGRF